MSTGKNEDGLGFTSLRQLPGAWWQRKGFWGAGAASSPLPAQLGASYTIIKSFSVEKAFKIIKIRDAGHMDA